jgi:5-formyltetrahydrofolate cyclo-ligase
MDKQEMRRTILKTLALTPGPDPSEVAAAICALEEYRKAETILAYVPLKSEVDVSLLIDRALEDGKTVAFPDMEPGVFNVADRNWRLHLKTLENRTQTTEGCPVLNIKSCNGIVSSTKGFILVPGLAFTEFGTRLGRGAGYYDQLLALMAQSGFADFTSIGICRKSQLVEELPQQPHDIKVDMVLAF